jgi:hypothetical protein
MASPFQSREPEFRLQEKAPPLERQIKELGFPTPKLVASLQSIAHLFHPASNRCGIYLLSFSNNTAYIGQAGDVVRRFASHRRSYDTITGFSFLPKNKRYLDEAERAFIRRAEELGLPLLNTVHTSQVTGETDLDLVVSPDEQRAWLSDPERFNHQNRAAEPLLLPASHLERFLHRFRLFQEQPGCHVAANLLRRYVFGCIPAAKKTEYSFWSLSCLPTTNRSSWPRLACISMGVMETFVVGYFRDDPEAIWGFCNVASDVLFEEFGSQERFRQSFPEIEVVSSREYRDAGQHQLSLHAWCGSDLAKLMESVAIRRAAGVLALRVMRKRATIYSKFHCKQLADYLMFASDE